MKTVIFGELEAGIEHDAGFFLALIVRQTRLAYPAVPKGFVPVALALPTPPRLDLLSRDRRSQPHVAQSL